MAAARRRPRARSAAGRAASGRRRRPRPHPPRHPPPSTRKLRRSQSGIVAARRTPSRRSRRRRSRQRGSPSVVEQHPEHGQPGADGHDHGDDREHLRGERLAQRGHQGDRSRDHEADDPDGPPPAGRDPQQCRDEQRADARCETLSTSLSFSPNRLTMRSLAPGGWSAMTRSPMAMTIDGAPATRPAMSSATAMATSAAMAPAAAAARSAERLASGRMTPDTCGVFGRIMARSWRRACDSLMTAPRVGPLRGARAPVPRCSGRRSAVPARHASPGCWAEPGSQSCHGTPWRLGGTIYDVIRAGWAGAVTAAPCALPKIPAMHGWQESRRGTGRRRVPPWHDVGASLPRPPSARIGTDRHGRLRHGCVTGTSPGHLR